jgi:hypothetical protein
VTSASAVATCRGGASSDTCGKPGHVDDVLDADGHAVKRAARAAGGDLALGQSRGIEGGLRVHLDERVDSRVERGDAVEQRARTSLHGDRCRAA